MGSPSSSTPRLVIIEGKDKGKVLTLKKGTAIVGRSKGDILVQDPRVSRSHVALHFDENKGELSYTDLKSLNGVIVNGELKETGVLVDGDKLQLGNTLFDCQLSSDLETEAGTFAKGKYKSSRVDSSGADSALVEISIPAPEPVAQIMGEETSGAHQVDPSPPSTPATATLSKATEEVLTLSPEEQGKPSPTKRKSLYSRIPKPVRAVGLALVLIVALLRLLPERAPSDPTTTTVDREILSVKKLIQEQKKVEAQAKAMDLAKGYPSHSGVLMVLGDAFLELKKTDLAVDAYRRAHALQPTQPLLHTKLVRVYLTNDLNNDAELEMKHLFDVLKNGPKDKEIYIGTAELYIDFPQLKTDNDKMLVLAKALQNSIAPEDAIGYKLEANLLLNTDKSPQAIPKLLDVIEKGQKIAPNDEWLLEKVVFARLSQTDTAKATESVERWMKVHAESTKPMLIMAYLKFNDKNYLGAVPYLQKVIQQLATNPTNSHYGEALHLMGQIYLQQSQVADAESFLKQACQAGFQESCSHPLVAGVNKDTGPAPASESPKQ